MNNQLEINDISKELLDLVPDLKKGQTVTFELITTSVQTMVNEDDSRTQITTFPTSQSVPSRDTIYDAYANNGRGEMIDIGFVTVPGTRNADPKFGIIQFMGSNGGRITITSDKKDLAKYRYLMLCNYNENSVNPDKSTPLAGHIFRTVKPEATASEKLELKRLSTRAKASLEILTSSELVELSKRFGVNSTMSEAEILDALYDVANDIRGAKTILNLVKDQTVMVDALLEDAIKGGVIGYNPDENEWRWMDTQRKIVGQQSGDAMETLKRYMAETDAGEKFHDNLKKAVHELRSSKKKK